MPSQEITVPLDYTLAAHSLVHIQRGLTGQLAQQIGTLVADRGVFLVTDENVSRLHGSAVAAELQKCSPAVHIHVVPAGESSKSAAPLHQLWNAMAACGLTREARVVALGGGVVGDLAGFAAATFGRGLAWLQIPTTLMAQVDSSLGGKVGINLTAGKNLVGCVWQPEHVLIDPDLLATLPWREFQSGLAEVVKYAAILGEPFLSRLRGSAAALRQRDPQILSDVIADCCRCKLELVRRDPLDQLGIRAALNYGHTFGHAIEHVAGYGTLTHGEAVAMGIGLAARLARRLGWVTDAFVETQADLLQRFELPTQTPSLPADDLVQAMTRDKKARRGQLRFVLPRDWGDLVLTELPTAADVAAVLAEEMKSS